MIEDASILWMQVMSTYRIDATCICGNEHIFGWRYLGRDRI